ncbi:MAG: twin-arginine translocation pathway signal protein [Vitreimonas sp.]
MTREDILPCAPPSPRSALKIAVAAFPALLAVSPISAPSSAAIDRQADRALESLYASSDNAQTLAGRAQAVLVFARVGGAGQSAEAQEGEGVMRIAGVSAAYYRIVGAPLASNGAHAFSLAFFFVAPSTLARLDGGSRWDLGAGANSAAGGILNTTTLTEDVYAVQAGQRGLMAGLGLDGSRIVRIHPSA